MRLIWFGQRDRLHRQRLRRYRNQGRAGFADRSSCRPSALRLREIAETRVREYAVDEVGQVAAAWHR